MYTEYIFKEDARKYKPLLFLVSILCNLGVLVVIAYEISTFFSEPSQKNATINAFIAFAPAVLILGISLPFILRQKYFKYCMFITKDYLEFILNGTVNKYLTLEFCGYETIGKRGLFSFYRLSFTDGKVYYITSVKGRNFQNILNRLLKNNRITKSSS